MLSGWYRATSPCRATASACYNTHTHISACRITFAGVACNQRCVAVAKCRTAHRWYVCTHQMSPGSAFSYPLSLPRVAASVALHILFALLVELETT